MNFVSASFGMVNHGFKLRRPKWPEGTYIWVVNARVQVVDHQVPTEEMPEKKFILLKTPERQAPWSPDPDDVIAPDWEELPV